jgi:hypothetical protein
MTPDMDRFLIAGGPKHVNADFAESMKGAEGRTSDHDPVFARFAFEPTGLSLALVGAASGGIGYHQPLRLK